MGSRRFVIGITVAIYAFSFGLVSHASAAAATQIGGPGFGAGQFTYPTGVAVDGMGDVYVGNTENGRVDKFDMSGGFLLAWGAGVVDGSDKLQTCMDLCGKGLPSSVAGGFEFPTAVAVDTELLSTSYGDVYVVDHNNLRVEKYGPSGEFLLMFGGHVNKTTEGDVCIAGEMCQQGVIGVKDGEFSYWPSYGSLIAVGPNGRVYVGDQARVEVFEPSGVWRENISLAALSSTGRPSALAVDSSGNIYVKDETVAGVRVFEPGGAERSVRFDEGSETITGLTLDRFTGHVFVADSNGGFHVLEYDSAGKELANFGSKTVVGQSNGLVFSEITQQLYASATEQGSVWVFAPPPPGPTVDSESAISGLRGTAALEGIVDPEGSETSYHFEYVDETNYSNSGFAYATSTATVTVTSGLFEDHQVSIDLSGLVPGTTYHYRIVAVDSHNNTTTGTDQTVTLEPPALIEGPWVTNVASTSATLAAKINPLGANTQYRLEYGTSSSYGHILGGNVGEGMAYVPISYHQQELEPGTTYHYRIVTTNEVGTVEGTDHAFTTQVANEQGPSLPDGRAWELVSPPDKKGGLIENWGFYESIQAAADGSKITYTSSETIGENPVGNSGPFSISQVLASRGANAWRSEDISVPQLVPKEGEEVRSLAFSGGGYQGFSPDLSLGIMEPGNYSVPLSSEATERTIYLRSESTGGFIPLVTSTNVLAGVKFGGAGNGNSSTFMHFSGASPDLSHVVLESPEALTPEAKQGTCTGVGCVARYNLYEWSGGRLQLVNVLPDGTSQPGSVLGHEQAAHAVSNDGRWVVWRPLQGAIASGPAPAPSQLYARDMQLERTVEIGGPDAIFQTMSGDGSRIFFLENGELYEFNTDSDTSTDLTAGHGARESNSGVKDALLGASEDGSRVYFVATGVLANGAIGGEDNLYVLHDGGNGWTTTYIGTLSGEDEKDWFEEGNGPVHLWRVTSRVSPDGRYLGFMSDRSLTGYDNVDAITGQPDEEVFLYDADLDRLVCASCDPQGARPVGLLDLRTSGSLLVDRDEAWGEPGHWLAGSIPGWRNLGLNTMYEPRYLSDSGRLFFNSPDALVPQDTNGLEDVYEYEPASVGGCASGNVTFSGRSGGCVSLISSGTSSGEAAFIDASENGEDSFFITSSKLVPEDYDSSYDLYDAHVCTTAMPCNRAPVSPPPCSSGDSCKAAPSPQPEIFGPAPSATFSGTGNVVEEAKKGVTKRKSKSKPKHKKRAKHKERKGKRAGRSRTEKSRKREGKR
jgi:hypothetical protein